MALLSKLRNIVLLCSIIAVVSGGKLFASGLQEDSSRVNKKRLHWVIGTEATLFAGSMFGLYHLWYSDYPQSGFHFINDNSEWQYMDKVGHAVSSYYVGKIGYESLRWSGVDKKTSAIYGGSLGFVHLLTVEILDGFSAEWGASAGDLLFNTMGSAAFVGQQLLWDEQRMVFKFSFHQSPYAKYNPDLMGKNYIQNMLKDYNGQTYWLSGNIRSFTGKNSQFPAWLNVAFGYGAGGMTSASENIDEYNGGPAPYFERYKQYYLSLDIDLTRIKTNSDILKIIFEALGFIKIPFPALEYNTKNELKFHWLYF